MRYVAILWCAMREIATEERWERSAELEPPTGRGTKSFFARWGWGGGLKFGQALFNHIGPLLVWGPCGAIEALDMFLSFLTTNVNNETTNELLWACGHNICLSVRPL